MLRVMVVFTASGNMRGEESAGNGGFYGMLRAVRIIWLRQQP
jgi:hypothetical protein